MARIPHPCVTISACLAGALLLLPLCWGDQHDFDYDSTFSPEYFDNSSIEYSFFSNGSTEELEKFLLAGGTDTGEDTSVVMNQASRSTSAYLLLTLFMMVYQLLRLL